MKKQFPVNSNTLQILSIFPPSQYFVNQYQMKEYIQTW